MSRNAPTTDLDKFLLGEICLQPAKGIEVQCKREYWQETVEDTRETQVHRITPDEKKNLPTNNLNTKRYLAKFGYLASHSAQHSNSSKERG